MKEVGISRAMASVLMDRVERMVVWRWWRRDSMVCLSFYVEAFSWIPG